MIPTSNADAVGEGLETVNLRIVSVTNSGGAVRTVDGVGLGAITEAPTASIAIGDAGSVFESQTLSYAITLAAPAGQPYTPGVTPQAGATTTVTVQLQLNSQLTTEDIDLTGWQSFTKGGVTVWRKDVTLAAGVQSGTLTIPTKADNVTEAAEQVTVTVVKVVNTGGGFTGIGDTGTGTIADGPTVTTVTSDARPEGTSLVHTVTLTAATIAPTQYDLSIAGVTATAGTDFTLPPTFSNGVTWNATTGKITVPAGVTTFSVTIPTVIDRAVEGSETLTLTVAGAVGTGTILDVPPQVDPVLTNADVPPSTNPAGYTGDPIVQFKAFTVENAVDGTSRESVNADLGAIIPGVSGADITFRLTSLPAQGTLYLDPDGDSGGAAWSAMDLAGNASFTIGQKLYWVVTDPTVVVDQGRVVFSYEASATPPGGSVVTTATAQVRIDTLQADPVGTLYDAVPSTLDPGRFVDVVFFKQLVIGGSTDAGGAMDGPLPQIEFAPADAADLGGLSGMDAEANLGFFLTSRPATGTLYVDQNGDDPTGASWTRIDSDAFLLGGANAVRLTTNDKLYWVAIAGDLTRDTTVNQLGGTFPATLASWTQAGVTLTGYDYLGQSAAIGVDYWQSHGNPTPGQGGIGVAGIQTDLAAFEDWAAEINYGLGALDGTSQQIKLEFKDANGAAQLVTDAQVSVSYFYRNEGEQGRVSLFRAGERIADLSFGPDNSSAPLDIKIPLSGYGGSSNGAVATFSLGSYVFDTAFFSAITYAYGQQPGWNPKDTSDYYLQSFNYKKVAQPDSGFDYAVKDTLGNASGKAPVEIVSGNRTILPIFIDDSLPSVIGFPAGEPDGGIVIEGSTARFRVHFGLDANGNPVTVAADTLVTVRVVGFEATAGSDFQNGTNGTDGLFTLLIAAGQSEGYITVPTVSDSIGEPQERFFAEFVKAESIAHGFQAFDARGTATLSDRLVADPVAAGWGPFVDNQALFRPFQLVNNSGTDPSPSEVLTRYNLAMDGFGVEPELAAYRLGGPTNDRGPGLAGFNFKTTNPIDTGLNEAPALYRIEKLPNWGYLQFDDAFGGTPPVGVTAVGQRSDGAFGDAPPNTASNGIIAVQWLAPSGGLPPAGSGISYANFKGVNGVFTTTSNTGATLKAFNADGSEATMTPISSNGATGFGIANPGGNGYSNVGSFLSLGAGTLNYNNVTGSQGTSEKVVLDFGAMMNFLSIRVDGLFGTRYTYNDTYVASLGTITFFRNGEAISTKTFGIDPLDPTLNQYVYMPSQAERAGFIKPDLAVVPLVSGSSYPYGGFGSGNLIIDPTRLAGDTLFEFDRIELGVKSFWNGSPVSGSSGVEYSAGYAINGVDAIGGQVGFQYSVGAPVDPSDLTKLTFSAPVDVTIGAPVKTAYQGYDYAANPVAAAAITDSADATEGTALAYTISLLNVAGKPVAANPTQVALEVTFGGAFTSDDLDMTTLLGTGTNGGWTAVTVGGVTTAITKSIMIAAGQTSATVVLPSKLDFNQEIGGEAVTLRITNVFNAGGSVTLKDSIGTGKLVDSTAVFGDDVAATASFAQLPGFIGFQGNPKGPFAIGRDFALERGINSIGDDDTTGTPDWGFFTSAAPNGQPVSDSSIGFRLATGPAYGAIYYGNNPIAANATPNTQPVITLFNYNQNGLKPIWAVGANEAVLVNATGEVASGTDAASWAAGGVSFKAYGYGRAALANGVAFAAGLVGVAGQGASTGIDAGTGVATGDSETLAILFDKVTGKAEIKLAGLETGSAGTELGTVTAWLNGKQLAVFSFGLAGSGAQKIVDANGLLTIDAMIFDRLELSANPLLGSGLVGVGDASEFAVERITSYRPQDVSFTYVPTYRLPSGQWVDATTASTVTIDVDSLINGAPVEPYLVKDDVATGATTSFTSYYASNWNNQYDNANSRGVLMIGRDFKVEQGPGAIGDNDLSGTPDWGLNVTATDLNGNPISTYNLGFRLTSGPSYGTVFSGFNPVAPSANASAAPQFIYQYALDYEQNRPHWIVGANETVLVQAAGTTITGATLADWAAGGVTFKAYGFGRNAGTAAVAVGANGVGVMAEGASAALDAGAGAESGKSETLAMAFAKLIGKAEITLDGLTAGETGTVSAFTGGTFLKSFTFGSAGSGANRIVDANGVLTIDNLVFDRLEFSAGALTGSPTLPATDAAEFSIKSVTTYAPQDVTFTYKPTYGIWSQSLGANVWYDGPAATVTINVGDVAGNPTAEPAPILVSVADRTVDEASGAVFTTFTLSAPAPQSGVYVHYRVGGGTVTNGVDVLLNSSYAYFGSGQTTAQGYVGFVNRDRLIEGDETFNVEITGLSRDYLNTQKPSADIRVADGFATVTISDVAYVTDPVTASAQSLPASLPTSIPGLNLVSSPIAWLASFGVDAVADGAGFEAVPTLGGSGAPPAGATKQFQLSGFDDAGSYDGRGFPTYGQLYRDPGGDTPDGSDWVALGQQQGTESSSSSRFAVGDRIYWVATASNAANAGFFSGVYTGANVQTLFALSATDVNGASATVSVENSPARIGVAGGPNGSTLISAGDTPGTSETLTLKLAATAPNAGGANDTMMMMTLDLGGFADGSSGTPGEIGRADLYNNGVFLKTIFFESHANGIQRTGSWNVDAEGGITLTGVQFDEARISVVGYDDGTTVNNGVNAGFFVEGVGYRVLNAVTFNYASTDTRWDYGMGQRASGTINLTPQTPLQLALSDEPSFATGGKVFEGQQAMFALTFAGGASSSVDTTITLSLPMRADDPASGLYAVKPGYGFDVAFAAGQGSVNADGTQLTMVLPAGQSGINVVVDVLNDGLVETNDETITVDVIGVQNGANLIQIADARGLALDPDAPPQSVHTVTEPRDGGLGGLVASLLDGSDALVGVTQTAIVHLHASVVVPATDHGASSHGGLIDHGWSDIGFAAPSSDSESAEGHVPVDGPVPEQTQGHAPVGLNDVFTDLGEIDPNVGPSSTQAVDGPIVPFEAHHAGVDTGVTAPIDFLTVDFKPDPHHHDPQFMPGT